MRGSRNLQPLPVASSVTSAQINLAVIRMVQIPLLPRLDRFPATSARQKASISIRLQPRPCLTMLRRVILRSALRPIVLVSVSKNRHKEEKWTS